MRISNRIILLCFYRDHQYLIERKRKVHLHDEYSRWKLLPMCGGDFLVEPTARRQNKIITAWLERTPPSDKMILVGKIVSKHTTETIGGSHFATARAVGRFSWLLCGGACRSSCESNRFSSRRRKTFSRVFRLRCLLCKRFALRNSENNSTNFIKLFVNILGVSDDSDFGLSDYIESFVAESSLSSI